MGKGDQKYGVLGNGKNQGMLNQFQILHNLEQLKIIDIFVKNDHCIAKSFDNLYYGWGRNTYQ